MAQQNPFDQQSKIPGVKHILVVGSGKGGVGKSTVSANLALALKKNGKKIGLLDADIYGPSVPRLFGALNQRPEMDGDGKIQPISRFGVSTMSIGYLVDEGQAAIWRGPMLFKAIEQLFRDVNWSELDYLIVDLPPGTGDVALTVAQKVPVSGAVTVSTPQNMALADAKKAIDMFEKLNIPLLGAVENMTAFVPPGGGEPIQLFPKGDLDAYLDAKNIKKLESISFDPQVSMASEAGIPICESSPSSEVASSFAHLAETIIEAVEKL